MGGLRRRLGERGHATFELALLLPLMAVLILGVIQFYDIVDKSFKAQWTAWRIAREALLDERGGWTIRCYRATTGEAVEAIQVRTPFTPALGTYRLSREAWLPTSAITGSGQGYYGRRYFESQLMPFSVTGC